MRFQLVGLFIFLVSRSEGNSYYNAPVTPVLQFGHSPKIAPPVLNTQTPAANLIPAIIRHEPPHILLKLSQCIKRAEWDKESKPYESCTTEKLNLAHLYNNPYISYPPNIRLDYECPQIPPVNIRLELCPSLKDEEDEAECIMKVIDLDINKILRNNIQELNTISQKVESFRFDVDCKNKIINS